MVGEASENKVRGSRRNNGLGSRGNEVKLRAGK